MELKYNLYIGTIIKCVLSLLVYLLSSYYFVGNTFDTDKLEERSTRRMAAIFGAKCSVVVYSVSGNVLLRFALRK
jgi:hypothetical protein